MTTIVLEYPRLQLEYCSTVVVVGKLGLTQVHVVQYYLQTLLVQYSSGSVADLGKTGRNEVDRVWCLGAQGSFLLTIVWPGYVHSLGKHHFIMLRQFQHSRAGIAHMYSSL